MDLVSYDQIIFNSIISNYKTFADTIGIKNFESIPISGLNGDNIASRSTNTKWYKGPIFVKSSEDLNIKPEKTESTNFVMPVQWVNRPDQDFRGFSGRIASGIVKPDQKVKIFPSNKTSVIDRIVTLEGDLDHAILNQSVTLTLKDEIDCSAVKLLHLRIHLYNLQISLKPYWFGWMRVL